MKRMFEKPNKPLFQRPNGDAEEQPKQDAEPNLPTPIFSMEMEPTAPTPTTPAPTPAATKTGRRYTIRISRKAKRRIDQMHANKREPKGDIFTAILDASSLQFEPDDLPLKDTWRDKVSAILTPEQHARLKAAAKHHKATLRAIASAMILNHRESKK